MTDRLDFEVKFDADADEGTFTGYASTFGGAADEYGDVIAPGAFTRTLSEHKAAGTAPAMFLSHDPRDPIGVWEQIKQDANGLAVTGRLILESTRGRDAHALMKAGALSGLSIGYRARLTERRRGGGRLLKAVDLVEISVVALPAARRARVTSVKGTQQMDDDETLTNDQSGDEGADALAERLDAVEASVKAMTDRADRIEVKLNRPGIRKDGTDRTDAEAKAFNSYLRVGPDRMEADERKDLRVSNDPQGGHLANPQFETEFLRDLVEVSPVRSVARVRPTGQGSVRTPKRTGITNAQWTGEQEETSGSEPSFGTLEVTVMELTTYTDISMQLLEDASADIEAELREALAEDFGQKEGLAFVNGSGVKQPEGLLTNADIAATVNGHATGLQPDAFITLMYALPAMYRNRGAWMMNGTTLGAVRKLKDGQGNYLWQPSFQAGQPETVLGRPVIEAVDMPDVANGAYPALFGDFAGYRIYDRVGLTLLRDPYTQATKGLVRFHARRRVGGAVAQAARFRKLHMST